MEIRHLGFDQRQNSRVFRFDVCTDGRLTKQVSVTSDIAVFRNHGVGISEGPFLSGGKLTAGLERGWEGGYELTADVRAYADGKGLVDAQRAGARKAPAAEPEYKLKRNRSRLGETSESDGRKCLLHDTADIPSRPSR